MKLHKREIVTNKAETEFKGMFLKLTMKHDLSYGEMVRILSGSLSGLAKWIIRRERHPKDPDKPGGIE